MVRFLLRSPQQGTAGAFSVMKLYASASVVALSAVALSACAEVTPGPGLDGAAPIEPVTMGGGGSRPLPPPITPITACFAQGTAIATPTGDVPIERIRVGDRDHPCRSGCT